MIQLAIVLQIAAIIAFVLSVIPSDERPKKEGLVVGGRYDYCIRASSGVFYAQFRVLEVKDGYVKCEWIKFDPAPPREEIREVSDLVQYSTLVPEKKNPFDKP